MVTAIDEAIAVEQHQTRHEGLDRFDAGGRTAGAGRASLPGRALVQTANPAGRGLGAGRSTAATTAPRIDRDREADREQDAKPDEPDQARVKAAALARLRAGEDLVAPAVPPALGDAGPSFLVGAARAEDGPATAFAPSLTAAGTPAEPAAAGDGGACVAADANVGRPKPASAPELDAAAI